MDEKKGTAATRAKDKYNAANYDQVKFTVKKGERERIDEAAVRLGLSRNAFILEAIEEKLRKAKEQQD
ncbi:transcriptional regulator [Paenibacillus filicis]|uniref:Transcriptional regulator n=1 Tax=Paenibacillus filicis TaxID=669464 RepID=A0ABU9DU02_9BACL